MFVACELFWSKENEIDDELLWQFITKWCADVTRKNMLGMDQTNGLNENCVFDHN